MPNASESTVITIESSTVDLRPILFISNPVGTLNNKNQKNTNEGNKLASESLKCRSAFT